MLHEVPFKANNNREAVVVCARHLVKRPSKRSVLVSSKMDRFVESFGDCNLKSEKIDCNDSKQSFWDAN